VSVKGKTVGFVGAGNMGEALIRGLVESNVVPAEHILIADVRADRVHQLADQYGLRAVAGNAPLVSGADVVILAVKPQIMAAVLRETMPALTKRPLVISLAAGVSTATIQSVLGKYPRLIRVMPNTPALVDEGMAAISRGAHGDESHLELAESLLAATGRVVRVPEKQQDAVTAISGSGPAYIFFVVESMIEAGVHMGLPRATATDLVVQTVVGSAKLLRETGEHPTVLRERVTSPGGTTAAAVRELEDHKVRAAFLSAIEAARNRSRDLAAE